MYLKEAFTQQTPQFRLIAIIASGILGLLSILLSFSITGALFDIPGSLFEVGHFFVDSYGALSFAIPAYLFFAAFLLADPIYRPERIFVLNAALFPFLTLAIGFVFIRDFSLWSERFPVLTELGKPGLNLFVVLLTTVEGIAITAFTGVLFPHGYQKREYPPRNPDDQPMTGERKSPRRPNQRATARHPGRTLRLGNPPSILMLPFVDKPSPPPEDPKPVKNGDGEAELKQSRSASKEFHLPELKPLASTRVLRHLSLVTEPDDTPQELEPEHPTSAPAKAAPDSLIMEETCKANRVGEEKPVKKPVKRSAPQNVWSSYHVPVAGILDDSSDAQSWVIDEAAQEAGRILHETLQEFRIEAEVTGIR
ncbi:MAG: hypothetical protein LBS86_01895, partial [Treponema sp.]|nr:hypothetical protein [Treponema sp.]